MTGTNVSKTNVWRSQERRVFESLSRTAQTRLQVAVTTGTPIQNVCRYVSGFRKAGKLAVLRRGTCPISKMTAEVVMIIPDDMPGVQLPMFQ